MQVRQAMTPDVQLADPDQSIQEAARMMADLDSGVLPVRENDRLIGMITDRDIAIRAVAAGKAPKTKVRDVMSAEVKYCFEDDDLEDVARNMAEIKVRRLPVLNQQKRLVGILSLADLALTNGPDDAGEAICGISEPGGEHSQSLDGGQRAPASADAGSRRTGATAPRCGRSRFGTSVFLVAVFRHVAGRAVIFVRQEFPGHRDLDPVALRIGDALHARNRNRSPT